MYNQRMETHRFVFDAPPVDGEMGLKITANRYRSKAVEYGGLTLVVTHGIGGHKEQLEPALQRIFQLQQSANPSRRVREAWSFDWQNHGDAAAMNEHALKSRPDGVSIAEWALAIASFLKSHHVEDHKIVGIGYSAGASALMLSTKYFPCDRQPFVHLFLIESSMLSEEAYIANIEETKATAETIMNGISARRYSWPSQEEAFEWLKRRSPWIAWDQRVLRIYAENGLRKASSLERKGCPAAVVLKCDRAQEAVAYRDLSCLMEANAQFGRICKSIPIHLIQGSRNDLIPSYVADSINQPSRGRTPASITRLANAGHWVLSEKPDEVAEAICNILNNTKYCSAAPPCRL